MRRGWIVALAGLLVVGVFRFDADAKEVVVTPPTTDFHTVVTEPGSGAPGSGGGTSPDEPPAPVCVWVRGGSTEIDTVARLSGVGAAIVREDAEDHILL